MLKITRSFDSIRLIDYPKCVACNSNKQVSRLEVLWNERSCYEWTYCDKCFHTAKKLIKRFWKKDDTFILFYDPYSEVSCYSCNKKINPSLRCGTLPKYGLDGTINICIDKKCVEYMRLKLC